MNVDLDSIRCAVREGHIVFSRHAFEEMAQESPVLLAADVEEAILAGEVIEDYSIAERGPCCLILGWHSARPIHVVVTAPRPEVIVITAYQPDPAKWSVDFRYRRGEGELL